MKNDYLSFRDLVAYTNIRVNFFLRDCKLQVFWRLFALKEDELDSCLRITVFVQAVQCQQCE